MWYVIQVKTGSEEVVSMMCQKMISKEILEESFVPRYERKKRYRGVWNLERPILFPGYVFLITDREDELFHALKKIPQLTKMLGDDEGAIALYEDEIRFLQTFGNNERVVEMSYGYQEGDKVIITEGPMQGYEGLIRKIDRHKRVAKLDVEFFGRTTDIWVGVEIVEKARQKNI